MKEPKTYIGDGVYAEIRDDGAVVLTTENGLYVTDTIVLERDVLECLFAFLEDRGLLERTIEIVEDMPDS